jgi:RNA polymerase sigma factor (sigma-70 family)
VTTRHARATEIGFYEGLIRKTAAIYAPRIQEDYDDILSILRIKVWRALDSYDPGRSHMPVERYVFACLRNQIKDLLKRKRRHEVGLQDAVEELRENAAVIVSADDVYADVEREPALIPLIPTTLTGVERDALVHLYVGASEGEVALLIGCTRPQLRGIIVALRIKLADWQPSRFEPVPVAASTGDAA